jgi:predicted MFS family arabinose efflux permease
LGVAGFFATAVAFGPARNGYGLFLPDIRREFGLSTELLGFMASGLYGGYLLALSAVGLLAARVGPRPLVMAGGVSAGLGMMLVAFAPNAWILAVGVVLAGTSAGWSWAPYNDAVGRTVPDALREHTLSVISTGTTFGIMVTGLVALLTVVGGMGWRIGWVAFAATALAATILNGLLLPGGRYEADETSSNRRAVRRWFLRAEAAPLFAVALSFGIVNSVYWSFAVDLISGAGGFSWEVGPLFYVVMGMAGFIGLFTGDAVVRFGLRWVLITILASLSLATFLIGVAPEWWPAVGVSAILFGMDTMLMSALLSIWSSSVFDERPSAGFSVTLFLFGIGSIVGPAAAGIFADQFGLKGVFLGSAALALVTSAVRPAKEMRSAAADPASQTPYRP